MRGPLALVLLLSLGGCYAPVPYGVVPYAAHDPGTVVQIYPRGYAGTYPSNAVPPPPPSPAPRAVRAAARAVARVPAAVQVPAADPVASGQGALKASVAAPGQAGGAEPECRTVTHVGYADGREVQRTERLCRAAPGQPWTRS